MENTGKWWDSFTNILALVVVIAMIAFTAMRILPIETFAGAVALILGAYFQKNGQKDGQQAAQSVMQTTQEKDTPVPIISDSFQSEVSDVEFAELDKG